MASKRGATDAASPSSSGAPPAKKLMTQFEPVKIGPIATLVSICCIISRKSLYFIITYVAKENAHTFPQEEMDVKVLQFQNKKLVERIEQRRKAEEQLKQRIEQLEQRQTTDDAVLCIVNRYWNQVRKTLSI